MTLSINQAAEARGVTRQAIFIAIKGNKLKASKPDGVHWSINKQDLQTYSDQRYSRKNLKHNGELVYPPDQGVMSVKEASAILKVKQHTLYYAIYKNRINYIRRGCAYVLTSDDVADYAIRNNIE